MTKLRVTKIICPSCEGSGKFRGLDVRCMWCCGEKRLPVAQAHRYADQLYMIAGGGYVCGDHGLIQKVEMEARAEAVYAITGTKAPWTTGK